MTSKVKTKYITNARVVAVFGIAIAILSAGCGVSQRAKASSTSEAPSVAVASVKREDLSSTVDIASEFQPYQEINVYAKVSGYVKSLNVDWGTHVSEGQLLAVLEVPELQQQLQLDEATVRRSEEDMARAQDELKRAQSAYNVAHVTYTRLESVQKTRPELIAQQEIDVAEGKDTEASASVSGAKDSVAASEQEMLGAKASLAKDQAMYSYARITAPFDGIITEIDAYKGALLPAGTSSNKGDQPLCKLSQNNLLRLVIPIPESAVPNIKLGNPVQITVPVLNQKLQGTVARISDQVDLSTRTMHTEIEVPNPTLRIVPGMYATVSLALKQGHAVLAVPLQALDRQGTQITVYRVDKSNEIEEQTVQLGIETPDDAEVFSGLHENDLVVVGNRNQLRVGMKVQPKMISNNLDSGGM